MTHGKFKKNNRIARIIASVLTVVFVISQLPGTKLSSSRAEALANDTDRRLISLTDPLEDAGRQFVYESPLSDLGVGTNILSFRFFDRDTEETLTMLDVEQDFGFEAILYAQEGVPYVPAAPRLVLVPYDTPHTLDGFEACRTRELVVHEGTETYGACDSGLYSDDYLKMSWSAPESLFSWNLYRESPGIASIIDYDPYDQALESGLYSPVVVYYMEDSVYTENPRGYLMFTNKVIRINNKRDGGYISDDFYGYEDLTEYVELKVNVDVYGEILSEDEVRVTVTVYDAMGEKGTCYGLAPCMVPANDRICLKIEPVCEAEDLKYQYIFPMEEEAFFSCDVPADGVIYYYADTYDREATVYGQVTAPMVTGDNETQITGFGGIDVSFTQKINGYTRSYLATTDSDGYYTVELMDGVPATVYVENNYFEAYTAEITRDDYLFKSCCHNIELTKKTGGKARNNNGALTASLTGKSDMTFPATAILFDAEGNRVDAGSANVGGSDEQFCDGYVSFEVPLGDYTMVVFDDSNNVSFYISSLQGVKNVLSEDETVQIEINKNNGNEIVAGELRKLEPVTVPETKVKNPDISPISEGSYINVPADFLGTSEPITISGHIECETGNIELQALEVYLEGNYSETNYLMAAGKYCDNSLVVNQEIAGVNVENPNIVLTKLSFKESIKGVADFSFRVEPVEETDIKIRVLADAVIDGAECLGLEVGKATVRGKKVTIEAPEKTAGSFTVKGNAEAGKTVRLYDNGSLLGCIDADRYGAWEMYVTLPDQAGGRKTPHKLYAVCAEDESETISVICDPEAEVLRGLYMVSEGKTLPGTYVWTPGIRIAFKAVYENMPVTDELSVFVLCSNDEMIELPASFVSASGEDAYGGYDENVSVYMTEEYPFGDEELVPVKAWAVTGGGTDGVNKTVEAAEEYEGVISSAQYRDRTSGYKAIDWDATKCIIGKEPNEETFPEGTSGIGYISYLTEEKELKALLEEGAYHTSIVDDHGYQLYDCYYLLKNGVSVYGFIDYNDYENYGQAYILTGSLVDSNGYAKEINSVYVGLAKSREGIRFADTSYPRTIEGQMAIAGGSGELFSEEIKKSVGPLVLDCLTETVNEALVADGKSAMYNVPWGDLLSVESVCESGYELYQVQQITTPAVSELMFYRTLMIGLSERDALDGKSYGRIDNALKNAINSMETADKIFKDTFVANVNSAIVGKGADLGGFWGKAAGAVGGMVGDLMTGDMSVNGHVVLSGAQGDYLEAKLYMMKAFGLTKDELNEMYNEYQQGLTFKTLRNKVKESVKDSREGKKFTPIVDPSGYVYEAVASNRVEGATVSLYSEGMKSFEAESYGQSNPLSTDAEGKYAWDVPLGNWFVKAYKAGYEVGTSQNDPAATVTIDGVNYLPVLPPQLDVNIPLMSESKAHGSVCYEGGKWYLKFDKYVQMDTVTESNIVFSTPAMLKALDGEVSPAHTPVCGGKLLARTFEICFEKEPAEDAELTVTLGEGLLTYNGKSAKAVIGLSKEGAKDSISMKDNPDHDMDDYDDDEDYDDDDDDDVVIGEVTERAGMPGWAIALIVVVVVAAAGAAVWFFVIRKKKIR